MVKFDPYPENMRDKDEVHIMIYHHLDFGLLETRSDLEAGIKLTALTRPRPISAFKAIDDLTIHIQLDLLPFWY